MVKKKASKPDAEAIILPLNARQMAAIDVLWGESDVAEQRATAAIAAANSARAAMWRAIALIHPRQAGMRYTLTRENATGGVLLRATAALGDIPAHPGQFAASSDE